MARLSDDDVSAGGIRPRPAPRSRSIPGSGESLCLPKGVWKMRQAEPFTNGSGFTPNPRSACSSYEAMLPPSRRWCGVGAAARAVGLGVESPPGRGRSSPWRYKFRLSVYLRRQGRMMRPSGLPLAAAGVAVVSRSHSMRICGGMVQSVSGDVESPRRLACHDMQYHRPVCRVVVVAVAMPIVL